MEGEDAGLDAQLAGHVVEQAADEADHRVGDGQTQDDTHSGSSQVVDHTLGHEHLDHVAALHADGPGHADLAAALGSQHDEDQEDQQDRGHD